MVTVPDAAVSGLASRQYGVVARRQLLALGLGDDAVDRRLAVGRLHPVHRGVYAVGHRALSREGWWMAGVLVAGPGGVLSHRSAAALWELRPDRPGDIEVVTPGRARSRPGVCIRRTALPREERTSLRRVPVTTPTRTLLDLAGSLPRHELERAVEEAERRRLLSPAALDALFAGHTRARGIAMLRAAVSMPGARMTRSDLETLFLRFLHRHGLPQPAVNPRIRAGGRRIEVDCVWVAQRVAVELDGHAHHGTRAAFERDRERDRLLQAAGWRVVRITWRQLRDEPDAVARDLRALLASTVTT